MRRSTVPSLPLQSVVLGATISTFVSLLQWKLCCIYPGDDYSIIVGENASVAPKGVVALVTRATQLEQTKAECLMSLS